MNIGIKATNTTLTSSIKENVQDKLSRLEKLLKPEDRLHVELEVNKRHQSGMLYRVEIVIQPHGFFAEARGNDFYEALDLVVPKIKEQLAKKKDKLLTARRKGK